MSAGDKIQCSDLDEALSIMDDLMKAGWDVEFEYKKRLQGHPGAEREV